MTKQEREARDEFVTEARRLLMTDQQCIIIAGMLNNNAYTREEKMTPAEKFRRAMMEDE